MRKRFCRQVMCLTLAMMLVVGMLPGMTFVAHASTAIANVYITVPEPVAGEHPCYDKNKFILGGNYYLESNEDYYWYYYDEESNYHELAKGDTFQAGVQYSLNVSKLRPKDGYYFSTGSKKVYVNEQEASLYYSGEYMAFNYTFPPAKQRIDSIELYHDSDIEAKNYTKNLLVSKINGEAFDGERYVSYQWYRSTSNFNNINDAGVTAWDDSLDGYKFVGGYAYGLRIHTLPQIEGYAYGTSVAVTLKTPTGNLKYATPDENGVCYFYFDKLAYKPDLESVDITMDGFYVGANIMDLTFTSSDPIKLDGGYGMNTGRYTINQSAEPEEYLSKSTFVAGRQYYLFFYLDSDLDYKGLWSENVKLNGQRAYASGSKNGRTYYRFTLPILTEADVEKPKISSVVISMPKAQPVAGDAVYYPTVVSVNGDTNLANAVSVNNSQWYQCNYHTPEGVYQDLVGDQFVQGKSYQFWLQVSCSGDYILADNCVVTVQSPSGNLEGELESKGTTYIEYNYYYNLGAPTELPGFSSYAGTLSGYHAGNQVQNTQLEIYLNGEKIPEFMMYGMMYAILDENQQFIEEGTLNYDTQYYGAMMVSAYNCKMDGVTEDTIKEVVTLNGIKPDTAMNMGSIWMTTFKLPILKQGTTCNGLEHDYASDMIPATFDTDGKTYKKCKGCGAEGDAQPIAKVSTVQLSQTTYTFDGQNKQPSVVVKDAAGKALVQDKDYSLVYPAESKAVGTYIVKVILKGSYSGTKDFTYKITTPHIHAYKEQIVKKATATANGKIQMKCSCGVVKSTTTIAKVSKAKLSVSSYLYNGKKKAAPKVIVKDSKGKTISTKYYTVKKPKSTLKNIGKYTYTIQFKGTKYSGTKKLTLTIKPGKTSITKAAGAKKAVTVKWKKGKKAQVTGYQVMVATNSKFTKNVKTKKIKGYSKTSYKMTKLKAKTKYYVKVRAYKVTKTGIVYGPWSAVKTVKTK